MATFTTCIAIPYANQTQWLLRRYRLHSCSGSDLTVTESGILQNDYGSYLEAARALNAPGAFDVVVIQHEFG